MARAVKDMDVSYAVLTSVTRDDLPDGGAGHFVKTVQAIRRSSPKTKIECLIPDFKGSESALAFLAEGRTLCNQSQYRDHKPALSIGSPGRRI